MKLTNHAGSNVRKLAAVASVAGLAAVGLAAPTAFASTAATPHLTPANTTVKATSSKISFSAPVDGVTLAVTCTSLTGSGKTPADGLTVNLPVAPKFTGCTDSLGGKDTVTTTGTWKLTANSTGSMVSLIVPIKGGTFVSSVLSSCKVIVAPTAVDKLAGKYNNISTLTFSAAKFAIDGSGCSAGPTSTATSVVKFTPGVKVVDS